MLVQVIMLLCPDRLWGSHTVFYPVVIKGPFPVDKETKAEAVHHSFLFSVKVRNA
jgi:hypothetical protein